MREWIHDWKPAASQRAHLLAASLVWTVVGAALLIGGVWWELRAEAWLAAVLLVAASAAGALKYRFVMRKSVRRITARIHQRGDGVCLGGVFSWQMWLLIGVMATAGRILRTSSLDRVAIGALYAAVGVAMLLAATDLWRAWYEAGLPASTRPSHASAGPPAGDLAPVEPVAETRTTP